MTKATIIETTSPNAARAGLPQTALTSAVPASAVPASAVPARRRATGTTATRTKATGAGATGTRPTGATPGSDGAAEAGNGSSVVGARPAGRKSAGAKSAAKAKVATPWGQATLVERLSVPQRSGGRRFASSIELLESADGERLVRFAYSTAGVVRRGPVTLRLGDLVRLREVSQRAPELAAALGWAGRPDAAGDA